MENALSTGLSIAIGLGLAAAAGFRVFVPLLVASAAAAHGHLPLSHRDCRGWARFPALIAFGAATFFEVVAYYVPWLDHLLDVGRNAGAVLAGMIVSASVMVELPPLVKWGVALIAGGGVAGIVQGATMLTRLKSTVTTAGLANPLVSTAELAGSLATSLLSLVVPVLVAAARRRFLHRRVRGVAPLPLRSPQARLVRSDRPRARSGTAATQLPLSS
jgi:hypothetical protein